MQLVAYGAQDIYLTGNPQITFFKVVYRRHTNFAMEAIEQTFNGVANFGSKVVCTIARNGDLVGRMIVEVDMSGTGSIRGLGHKLIKSAEVEIGGQRIDKHYGEWLDIWNQLCETTENKIKLAQMINGNMTVADDDGARKLYIPLQFWFNRNPGLALPLIALQYHEVKIVLEFNKQSDIATIESSTADSIGHLDVLENTVKLNNVCLFCDYIFLDTDERRRFAQVSHEYLIEQLQTTGTCSFKSKVQKVNIPLNFNHPCKELVWVVQDSLRKGTFNFAPMATGNAAIGVERAGDYVCDAVLQLNGHDRFRRREGSYFRLVQPYQHHGGAPDQGMNGTTPEGENGYIYAYSFALKPCEHQPSGTCNFSRIDNAVLNMSLDDVSNTVTGLELKQPDDYEAPSENHGDKDVRVYTTNYNVLRIMSGMGGLAYSN
jgi:hypothetical protein